MYFNRFLSVNSDQLLQKLINEDLRKIVLSSSLPPNVNNLNRFILKGNCLLQVCF